MITLIEKGSNITTTRINTIFSVGNSFVPLAKQKWKEVRGKSSHPDALFFPLYNQYSRQYQLELCDIVVETFEEFTEV